MGKIEGVRIQNFGPLRDIVMGKTLSNQKNAALNNVTVIIGDRKSTRLNSSHVKRSRMPSSA